MQRSVCPRTRRDLQLAACNAHDLHRGRFTAMPDETPQPDVAAAAADPTSITVDGVSVTNRTVEETIAAERHLASKTAAATNNTFGIAFRRIIPGSAVGQ